MTRAVAIQRDRLRLRSGSLTSLATYTAAFQPEYENEIHTTATAKPPRSKLAGASELPAPLPGSQMAPRTTKQTILHDDARAEPDAVEQRGEQDRARADPRQRLGASLGSGREVRLKRKGGDRDRTGEAG